jgi:glycerol-3-phosphate acyltransferase PlsY
MDDTLTAILLAAFVAYLLGSLPFGFLVAKFGRGIDIRSEGSGNIGATNVARVLGAKWGIGVLFLDLLKGLLPVWSLPLVFLAADDPQHDQMAAHLAVACGTMTVVGHMFPCWLGFRGGKGVATALGVVLMLGPWSTLAAVATFATVFGVSRIVSLASMLAAVAFAGCQMWLLGPSPFSESSWSVAAFSLAVPLLIIARHRTNVVRLWRGDEPRFRSGSSRSKNEEHVGSDHDQHR